MFVIMIEKTENYCKGVKLMLEELTRKFTTFAEKECKGTSDLYERLALEVAEDVELLKLSAHAQKSQPVPNMLFAAVHHLLLQGAKHELAEYYPSITEIPRSSSNAFYEFQDFCQKYRHEIIEILATKSVQTNEVGRCAYLYPIFSFIYEQVQTPLACIEIGTSAGLQLLWDQYRYDYGTGSYFGNKASDVTISAEIKAAKLPALYEQIPVEERIGIDLNINDLTVEEDLQWLLALIWPEHHSRRNIFQHAAKYVQKASLTLVEGDGVDLLPELAERIAENATICVFHTHVANQIPEEKKHMLMERVREIGLSRNIFHIYNNMWDRDLHVDAIIDGELSEQLACKTDGHGRWFTWEKKQNG